MHTYHMCTIYIYIYIHTYIHCYIFYFFYDILWMGMMETQRQRTYLASSKTGKQPTKLRTEEKESGHIKGV
jgi:hypothetical protein